MTELTYKQALRYSRQVLLHNFDLQKQEVLMSSKVLLLGVGGLGCAAAQYLVASGVGQITLVDDDVVDESNLQRQVLHNHATVGMSKVESAAKALIQLNESVRLDLVHTRLDDNALKAQIQQHDIVVDCTDNFTSRQQINAQSYELGVPLVSGAAIRMEGQVLCVAPKHSSACYACFSHMFGEQDLSCMESGVMSPIVGVIGSTQALEAIKMLTDYGKSPLNSLQMFDGMTSQWRQFNVIRKSDCHVCGRFQSETANKIK